MPDICNFTPLCPKLNHAQETKQHSALPICVQVYAQYTNCKRGQELDHWLAESMDNQRLFEQLTDTTHLAEDIEKMRPIYEARYGGTWLTRTIR